MGDVVRFPSHRWHRCDKEDCPVCRGELGWCVTCCGTEGSLTTDCPGRRLTEDEALAVADGDLDYLWREGWVVTMSSERKS